MNSPPPVGAIYRCPVCGSELVVLAGAGGALDPRCCNRPMVSLRRRAVFYHCPTCGSAIVAVNLIRGVFAPRCCNRPMELTAA
jgi:desulfoferrodoxin-like iron-binding protein